MAVQTWDIEIPENWFFMYHVVTQAEWEVHIKLTGANDKVYFDEKRSKSHIEPPLATGFAWSTKDMKLTVEVPGSKIIRGTPHVEFHYNDDQKKVGWQWIYSMEAGEDQDYNDASVVIVGWKSKG
ncbi:Uncharacterised protein [uncultured archaeon]|nr:Uncharacterised protein [uncultured archaeon]